MNPGIREEIMNPGIREEIMNPVIREEIMNPGIREEIMSPGIREEIMNPGIREEIMTQIKVGEYMREGTTLTFDGHCVSVIKREHFPHFIVSSIQVTKAGVSRNVQHYQYTSWPDYDIPNEASSLAQMIRHFQRSHCTGGTVVHCSAGSARTGTVLQVLLMYEMITIKRNFNPLEAVKHLRECRAQLADSQVHYNFSLQVLDEILFGEDTIVTAQDLLRSLDSYLKNSSAEFIRMKALPSPLTYKGSSNPRFLSMNRNISVLPADFHRVQLQTEHGQPESQYINAVTLTGIHKEALIVTEHPLPVTLSKFWRLVVEKSCSLVLLLNTFDKQIKEEFPDIIPDVEDTWTLGDFNIQVQESQPYGNYLIQYTVNITDLKVIHSCAAIHGNICNRMHTHPYLNEPTCLLPYY
nr:receptor-type tyrosine-protein phosphatase C-like [Cherax quadricarinatus]